MIVIAIRSTTTVGATVGVWSFSCSSFSFQSFSFVVFIFLLLCFFVLMVPETGLSLYTLAELLTQMRWRNVGVETVMRDTGLGCRGGGLRFHRR